MKTEEFFDQIKRKIDDIDLDRIMDMIKTSCKRIGRVVTRQILRVWFVLKEGDLTPTDKVKIYACLLYILIPGDLLSRKVFGLLGIADDAAALVFLIRTVAGKVTADIDLKVEMKLDELFGYTITRGN